MELRAFVKQVLDDIDGALSDHVLRFANGQDAQGRFPGQRPGSTLSRDDAIAAAAFEHRSRLGDVTFDVAVTTSDSKGSEGKGGVEVLGIGVGGKITGENKHEVVQRIQFTIRGKDAMKSSAIVPLAR
jgi:hypothetical protein